MKGTPPMTDKKLSLEQAEELLAALEKPKHDVDRAAAKLRRAEFLGETDEITKAAAAYADALKAQEAAGVNPRDVAIAAQAVLDARGETHTETNVLPGDHGLDAARAAKDLALADSEKDMRAMEEAQSRLESTTASATAAKAQHVTDGHQRTLAAQAEAAKGEE